MAEHVEGEPEPKRVSVGDALEALRRKKAEKDAAMPTPPAPNPSKPAFIPPQFWMDNLQDGVQRSRDKLFDSIAANPTAATGMGRRDFAATESFVIPEGMLQEVGEEAKFVQRAEPAEASPLNSAAILDVKVLSEAGLIEEQTKFGEG